MLLSWIPGQLAQADPGYEQGITELALFAEIPSVITATLHETNTLLVPATVTVFNEMDIKASGAKDLVELLQRALGLVETSLLGPQWHVFPVRGLANSPFNNKLKLMINGHSVSLGLYGTFPDEIYNVGLENVKQVEIVRGPGSALYGTGAFAGVINVITKQPEDNEKTQIDLDYDTFDSYTGNVNYGGKFGDFLLGLNVYYTDSEGSRVLYEEDQLSYLPSVSAAPHELGTSFSRFKADATLKYKDWQLDLSYTDARNEWPISSFNFFTQDGNWRDYKAAYAVLKKTFTLTDKMNLELKASYDHVFYHDWGQLSPDNWDTAYLIPIFPQGILTFPDGWRDESEYEDNQFKGHALLDAELFENNKLLFGLFYELTEANLNKYNFNLQVDNILSPEIPLTNFNYTFDLKTRHVYGAFFQDEWTFFNDLTLLLAGRYDSYNDVGDSLTPRVALVWKYLDSGSVKAMYNTAFRAPSLGELYQLYPVLNGNDKLKPETVTGYELVWNQLFMEHLLIETSLFKNEVKDTIGPNTAVFPYVFENLATTYHQGVELNAKYYFDKKNYVYAGYSYVDNRDEDNEPLGGYDKFGIAGLNVNYNQFNLNVHAGFRGDFTMADPSLELPTSLAVVNTNLMVEDIYGFDIHFAINNLFNASGKQDNYLNYPPIDPTRYDVGLTYKF